VASDDEGWRAVGVRSLTRAEDRELRLRATVDPSPRVRRAAMHAIAEVRDPEDAAVAFEVARVDPDPMVRTDAVRAMGLIARAGADVASRLRDLYATADDALREDIGAAWASPVVFPRGGREALVVLLASDSGPGGLSAAGAVLREPDIHDAELEASARAALARAIASGSRRNRLHAIAITPLVARPREPASDAAKTIAVLREASRDEDLDVRVSALARLAGEEPKGADRADAMTRLEALAGRADDEPLASRARLALARDGDVRVQAWIEQDLASKDPRARLAAVDALVALGRASRGAPALADPDVSVRTRAACALLLAARLGDAPRPEAR
jgi:HEAT repeat protein